MKNTKRGSMHLDRHVGHNSSIEAMALVSLSVGHVERSTLRDIVHRIRVVCLIYIVLSRNKLLGMLVKEFLIFM